MRGHWRGRGGEAEDGRYQKDSQEDVEEGNSNEKGRRDENGDPEGWSGRNDVDVDEKKDSVVAKLEWTARVVSLLYDRAFPAGK